MKIVKYLLIIVLLLALVVWLGVKDALHPTVRAEIKQPIFTIGDLNYQQALQDGKNVVKFGPMFWGLYPGGLAFSHPDEAVAFISGNQPMLDKFSSGWAVYELAGDFALDTQQVGKRRFLSKSLLVKQLALQPK